jgi:CRP/FNR family transcriptional regulator, anaerobic regulatory protein
MSTGAIERWMQRFPDIAGLSRDDADRLARVVHFPTLAAGQVAYEQEGACHNYLMCIEGRTRVFKTSSAGREMLLYKVEDGGTCVLTTQCLLSRTNFPAESVAETETTLAAIPARSFHEFMAEMPGFRDLVMADYTKLLASMFAFIDTVAFATVEQRLARRLLVESGASHIVVKTHQQLASEVGSVREIVSRHLGDWERHGWVRNGRGQIQIIDRAALASRQPQ